MRDTQVLIAGAGPTGLALALWLTKQGIAVRIIDRAAQPGTTSRALAVQARTLELYRQLDLTEEVLRRGQPVAAINLWVKGRKQAHGIQRASSTSAPDSPPTDLSSILRMNTNGC